MRVGLKIFSGNSNLDLAHAITRYMGIPLGAAMVASFSDGEIQVEFRENVRGMDVFVLQSTCCPVNDNIMELLVMIDALKRASASRVTAVMPYYGYARQDRKVASRAPITAKLIADIITAAGADRVLTIDLHAGQIQGFFDIPVDHLYASPIMAEAIKTDLTTSECTVVSPDAGGVERARAFAKRLGSNLAIIDKRRSKPNESDVMHVIGDVSGRDAIILDDMVDTAGTLCKAAVALGHAGARNIYACATHAVLSGSAVDRINQSPIKKLYVTDTIPTHQKLAACSKLQTESIAPLLGEAISRIHREVSVSELFV
ncbi:ribose-phosphate pyrophosphokinase [Desulfomonile tiedjei]|uniref:Ribose-phosphate pyrophosphokinase n=1 Tax=Desulfomonile tiedjei (strain ATCC 49306 / DSM 6799 / DCB-1) TaxID=706587 RepID=I4CA25_DESTA|nr:ribose-phosphate pyrophosphokinase [Desulfomonile tiedjei]AFM26416.1 ribose-phosphate pyrophosphokinase [Desulfomonile tiedjei DSM 6799]